MSADACELLTSLYALRSQAGCVRSHSQRMKLLGLTSRMATIQEELTSEIEKLSGQPASAPEAPSLNLPDSRYID